MKPTKPKGKIAKGSPVPGENKKGITSPAAHRRGFVAKQEPPKAPPDEAEGSIDQDPEDLTDAGEPGESGVEDGGNDSIDEDGENCSCGDAGCPGCIIGAMKNPTARASFVKQVKKSK